MYSLYVSKDDKVLKVTKARKVFRNIELKEEGVIYEHNDCTFFCTKRKPLVERARTIKQRWVEEAEENLKLFRDISV